VLALNPPTYSEHHIRPIEAIATRITPIKKSIVPARGAIFSQALVETQINSISI